MASYGPTGDEPRALVGTDAADWIRAQAAVPATSYETGVRDEYAYWDAVGNRTIRNNSHTSVFWRAAIEGEDQLRQRMSFALSQIVVASTRSSLERQAFLMSCYQEALSSNALGNYRDLLDDVTYTAAMGRYLTYRNNVRAFESLGTMPDENYAREIMQLFTIGLDELNPDGTPRLDGRGRSIPTYDNDDVVGLARVFTGLREPGDRVPAAASDTCEAKRLTVYEPHNEDGEKTFLGTTIPAGLDGDASIARALDALFAHPNVGPFVGRQLIQRFTASHPEPAYVARVAAAFDAGAFTAPDGTSFGTGRRGDLLATVAAVLLDPSVHLDAGQVRMGDAPGASDTTALGKLVDPVLLFTRWARAFRTAPVTPGHEDNLLYHAESAYRGLAQLPFRAPSVFNFYRPLYVAPGTEAGAAGLTVPELQIVNGSSRIGYVGFMHDYVRDDTPGYGTGVASFVPDYAAELALADDPDALAEHLDTKLLSGRMTVDTRATIVDVLNDVPVRTDDADDADDDRRLRTELAVTIVVTSPEWAVQE